MKNAAALLLVFTVTSPEIKYFRYQRPVSIPTQKSGQACIPLDAAVFAHAAPTLPDLRLYRDGTEVPYLLHQVTPPEQKPATIPPLNTGVRGGQVAFDVSMPEGHYTDVDLVIAAENFVATVSVSGSQTQGGTETNIGAYTIFDLSHQKLGRGTTLALPESDFRYLHFRIKGPLKAENIQGVQLQRTLPDKPHFVRVAGTGPGVVQGHTTVLSATIPAHVPVDRIVVSPSAPPAAFHRTVRVTATPLKGNPDHPVRENVIAEGSILRVHGIHEGQRIDDEQLDVTIPGGEVDQDATWTIAIDNGDDAPLRVESARLEMVERDLCFDVNASSPTTLYYGDAALSAPRYDYGAFTSAEKDALAASLAGETLNAAYQPRPDDRPFTERYPWLLWAALCGVVAVLGVITFRTAKKKTA